MLDEMADLGRTDASTEPTAAPSEKNVDAAADEYGSDAVAPADAASGAAGTDSVRRASSLSLLADLERRVRQLEARMDGLEDPGRSSRWTVKASDLVRWGLLLVVIAFLAYYWLRMGAPR
jgi:hypothetical protein